MISMVLHNVKDFYLLTLNWTTWNWGHPQSHGSSALMSHQLKTLLWTLINQPGNHWHTTQSQHCDMTSMEIILYICFDLCYKVSPLYPVWFTHVWNKLNQYFFRDVPITCMSMWAVDWAIFQYVCAIGCLTATSCTTVTAFVTLLCPIWIAKVNVIAIVFQHTWIL